MNGLILTLNAMLLVLAAAVLICVVCGWNPWGWLVAYWGTNVVKNWVTMVREGK